MCRKMAFTLLLDIQIMIQIKCKENILKSLFGRKKGTFLRVISLKFKHSSTLIIALVFSFLHTNEIALLLLFS